MQTCRGLGRSAERIEPAGVQTSEGLHEFDIIIYATGFDAVTGAFDRIDFIGVDGRKLRDKWIDGPITYLGMQTNGFPNLITLAGPTAGSVWHNAGVADHPGRIDG